MRKLFKGRKRRSLRNSVIVGLFIAIISGGIWIANRYVPPQHLFWKPLDTSLPLGFATKQQLFALNLKPSKTCLALARDTTGFKTARAEPQRPSSGGGKGVCGWDVALDVFGTNDVSFAPSETQMQCTLSVAAYLWQREVDTLARKYFNQPLAKIHHYGSYSCRRQRGNSSGQWSEHAFANAWDVAGFELKDGTRINILKDWNGERNKVKFLRGAREAACDIFRVTLSPDYNEAHKDHFHLDMGPTRSCS